MKKSTLIVGAGIAAALVVGTGGGAYAAAKITGADIVNGTVTGADVKNKSLSTSDLTDHAIAALKGAKGADGKDGLKGAFYSVAVYKNGGAGDATVACVAGDEVESQKYTAIAGGVQAGGVQSMGQTSEFDVAGSFPGRMDWSTGTPKPNRLDGWIVLGSGGWSDTLKVWALCVPNTDIPVNTVEYDN